jgi:death-on-curing protein
VPCIPRNCQTACDDRLKAGLLRERGQPRTKKFQAEALHGIETQIKNIMSDLTVEKIIEIHDEIILKFDGAHGILSESTIHFMVYRINKTKDIFRRAATALHAIGSQHPFVDGNKRTALVVAENVLGQEGYYIAADEDSIVEFMLSVASYKSEPDEIEQWLRMHVKTMEN